MRVGSPFCPAGVPFGAPAFLLFNNKKACKLFAQKSPLM